MRQSVFTQDIVETVQRWDGNLLGPSAPNRGRESVRVFRASWFETYFATAHPVMPGVWWGPVLAACTVLTVRAPGVTGLEAWSSFVGGLLLWTLVEYLLHRFLFHKAPDATFDSKLRQFLMHGYHHEFPNDRRRLVAPLVLSVPLGVPVALGYYLLFRSEVWLMWFAGTVTGYLAYDWIHYYTHHFRPKTRLGKFLRRYHMEHHYKHSESHFGISSPLWDWVFGTHKARTKPKAKATDSAHAAH